MLEVMEAYLCDMNSNQDKEAWFPMFVICSLPVDA
jgi:hypothetical protein